MRRMLAQWIAEVMRVALKAEHLVLLRAIKLAEVADVVPCNVVLITVLRAHVVSYSLLKGFAVDQSKFLREERQIAIDDRVASCDGVLLHRQRRLRIAQHFLLTKRVPQLIVVAWLQRRHV